MLSHGSLSLPAFSSWRPLACFFISWRWNPDFWPRQIWDTRAPGYQRDYQSKAMINTVALHPNQGELIAGDEDGNIRVWDLAANSCSYELVPDGKTAIRSICVASDASIV